MDSGRVGQRSCAGRPAENLAQINLPGYAARPDHLSAGEGEATLGWEGRGDQRPVEP
jgi:hypothetical protein